MSMDAREIREALKESLNGRGNVYGMDVQGKWFRIIGFRLQRGYYKGKNINTGKWVVFYKWETR